MTFKQIQNGYRQHTNGILNLKNLNYNMKKKIFIEI